MWTTSNVHAIPVPPDFFCEAAAGVRAGEGPRAEVAEDVVSRAALALAA